MTPGELWRRLTFLVHRERFREELEEEIRLHQDLRAAAHREAGMAERDAAAASRRGFGNTGAVQEASRDAWGVRWLDSLGQDLRYALRRLARAPGESLIVVLSLGAGIGAVCAMLGVVDTLYLRVPAGIQDPAHVVGVGPWSSFRRTTYPDYMDLKEARTAFEGVGAFAAWEYSVRINGGVVPAHGMLASSTLLRVLGITPVAGREFTAAEDHPGAEPVVLVTQRFWRRQEAAGSALGATLYLADRPFTVIGVLPADFTAPDLSPVDLVLPITNAPWLGGTKALESRDYSWLRIVGRLRPGVTLTAATARASAIYRRANRGVRSVDQDKLAEAVVPVRPIVLARRDPNSPVARTSIWITALTVTLLLIACANAASVLLAQGVRQRHAFAIHAALGASRRRLGGRVLLEAALLVSMSTALALVLTRLAGVALTSLLLADSVPRPTVDWRMVVILVGVGLGTTGLCALVPTLRAFHTDPRAELAGGCPTTTTSHRLAFRLLIIAQTALCFVLVSEAIVFGASLRNATRFDLGINFDHLIIADADLHAAGLEDAEARAAIRRILTRVSAIPGVIAVGITDAAALPSYLTYSFTVPSGDVVSGEAGGAPEGLNGVTTGYLEALGIGVVVGRGFTDADVQAGRPVMLVSRGFAEHYWSRQSPLGQCVKVGGPDALCALVVGVVRDRHAGPGDTRPDIEAYVPLASSIIPEEMAGIFPGREVAIRTDGDPGRVETRVRAALLDAVPQLTSVRLRSGEAYMERQLRSWRLGAGVLSASGVVALVLAAIGVFGVSACAVAQRARELGIRSALGARPGDLGRIVFSESAKIGAAGILVGVVIALAAAHVVRALAFGISPLDTRIYVVAAAGLLVVSLLAAVLPAFRASGANPAAVLRSD